MLARFSSRNVKEEVVEVLKSWQIRKAAQTLIDPFPKNWTIVHGIDVPAHQAFAAIRFVKTCKWI